MAGSEPPLVVHLDSTATAVEVEEIREAVQSSGLTAEVRTDWQKELGTGNGAFWMVAVDLVQQSIPGLIAGLGVQGVTAFVAKLRHARRSAAAPDGWVELRDPDETQLLVGEAAEEAFEKLRDLNPGALRGQRQRWDGRSKQWVPY